MDAIVARWIWLQTDLEEGRKQFSKINASQRFLRTFVLAAVAAILLFRAFSDDKHDSYLATLAILIVAIITAVILVKVLISPSLRQREFNKRPDANQEIAWSIDNENITIISPDTRSEVRWTHFYKVVSTPVGFLFMPNAQIFQFIPNRAFLIPADIEKLKTLARDHAKDYKEIR